MNDYDQIKSRLFQAVERGDIEEIKRLISIESPQTTPLHVAVKKGDTEKEI